MGQVSGAAPIRFFLLLLTSSLFALLLFFRLTNTLFLEKSYDLLSQITRLFEFFLSFFLFLVKLRSKKKLNT